MKFDLVVTNPPFQDSRRRGKTPHKLWIDFTRVAFERLLADGAVLAQVSPGSFLSPNSRVLELMRTKRTPVIRLDTEHHFPGVGSTFADYVIINEAAGTTRTKVVRACGTTDVTLAGLLYIPNDRNPISLSIHDRVVFSARDKLPVEWDYVTCHNIRRFDPDPSLSRERTNTHVHPVFHTNRQTWWSAIRQGFAGARKVMWTRSGYTKPFYDAGVLGGTDMAYFVRVPDDLSGDRLACNMNLKLMKYVYATAKWSGFGNERVFAALPAIPMDRILSDSQLYDRFGLTENERLHVERYLARD